MKTLKITLLASLICLSPAVKAQNFSLSGTLDDLPREVRDSQEGEYALLINPHTSRIDSARISNGQFHFVRTVVGDSACYLRIASTIVPFVLQPGEFQLRNLQVHGSELNERFAVYLTEKSKISTEFSRSYSAISRDTLMTKEEKSKARKQAKQKYEDAMEVMVKPLALADRDNCINTLILCDWVGTDSEVDKFEKAKQWAGDYTLHFMPFQVAEQRILQKAKVEVGKPFVDFYVEKGSLDGTPARLSDYVGKGKYILVDFWASWCGPCRAEIPNLKKAYEKFHGDKFDMLSVAVWDKHDKTLEALKQENMPWHQMIDTDNIATDAYAISGIPQIMLFGPDGTIVAKGLRGNTIAETLATMLGTN